MSWPCENVTVNINILHQTPTCVHTHAHTHYTKQISQAGANTKVFMMNISVFLPFGGQKKTKESPKVL